MSHVWLLSFSLLGVGCQWDFPGLSCKLRYGWQMLLISPWVSFLEELSHKRVYRNWKWHNLIVSIGKTVRKMLKKVLFLRRSHWHRAKQLGWFLARGTEGKTIIGKFQPHFWPLIKSAPYIKFKNRFELSKIKNLNVIFQNNDLVITSSP